MLAYIENGGISGSYVSRVEVAGANNAAGNVYKGYVQAVYPVDGRVVIRDAREYFFGGWYPYSNTLTLNISPGAPVYLTVRLLTFTGLPRQAWGCSCTPWLRITGLE